jgi:polyphosphate kinase
MLERTNISEAPWWVVQGVDKKKARLNCISHLLQQVPYEAAEGEQISLPSRIHHENYARHPVPESMIVPDSY